MKPALQRKRLARLRRALRGPGLPAYIDLVDWLKTRGHAQTTGAAKRLMLDGKVKVDSHTVGRVKNEKGEWVPRQLVTSEFRGKLHVVD